MTTIYIIGLVLLALVAVALCVNAVSVNRTVKEFLKNNQKQMMLQMKIDEHKEASKTIIPIRLQAYERMVLFLERISPDSLIMRCYKPGMNIQTLQVTMSKNIREEWEHNLSQQVYLSSESWARIRNAKDEMINLINASAVNLSAEADPTTLAAAIFTNVVKTKLPTDEALEFLKKEINERF